ncbi:hypothetical protein [Pseudalkalibacillus decolorationis]|uniref:hypothetical protein n=1 Tax=Pseudalkalibacillus decolorationis TaxID=163879 RepID=UPI002148F2A4|nr:hypothetical protein [Pseudalkalibacillus decolorationis]
MALVWKETMYDFTVTNKHYIQVSRYFKELLDHPIGSLFSMESGKYESLVPLK